MSQTCAYEELDPHEQNECYYRKGGITAYGVLKEGHGITDYSNAIQVQAAITAGNLIVFKKIKANYPEPTAVEGENVVACGSETITDGYDHTFEVKDFNVNANNDAVIVQLNNSEFSGLIWFYCEDEEVRVVERGVRFNARGPIGPETNKEKQHYLNTAKWYQGVQEPLPVLYDAPTGIFE
jgi:hypothetical protein